MDELMDLGNRLEKDGRIFEVLLRPDYTGYVSLTGRNGSTVFLYEKFSTIGEAVSIVRNFIKGD